MRRSIILFIVVCLLVLLTFEPALAQCAMCRQTLENSEQAEAAARGMNAAIIIMFFPPVIMFIGIFGLIYRFGKRQKEEEEFDSRKI